MIMNTVHVHLYIASRAHAMHFDATIAATSQSATASTIEIEV
jgi:hypothetical protein